MSRLKNVCLERFAWYLLVSISTFLHRVTLRHVYVNIRVAKRPEERFPCGLTDGCSAVRERTET